MIHRIFFVLLLLVLVSCSPTSWLKLDILNPAEYTFSDTGKIAVLNAAYFPSVMNSKSNLITQIPSDEQFIIDTLVITNLFNGFFSVINESLLENLRNAEYEEIRTIDTTNFLGPLSEEGVVYLCRVLNSRFLISFEYYGFNRKESNTSSSEDGWEFNLEVGRKLVWRIYRNDGIMVDQYIDTDTLYWLESVYTGSLPELPDALRETFFLAGEKYGRHISPNWTTLKRKYFLLSRKGEDISLDRDQLLSYVSSKRKNQAFKACYNLAVLDESEDKLKEAVEWLNKADEIIHWEELDFYREKLKTRIINRQKIDFQAGKIQN